MRKTTLAVTSLHLFFILLLLLSPEKKTPLPKKHIAIRTVSKKAIVQPAPTAVRPQKTTPAKPTSPQKKLPPSKTLAKTLTKKPAVIEKGKPKAPQKNLEEIDEPLAKIEKKSYPKPRLKLDVPQLAAPVPDVAPAKEDQKAAEETLASFLHDALNLPEFGEVKIQLTVKKDGTVTRLVVLQSESKKNKAYLEEYLPRLQFPLVLEQEKTFILTFCNEI